MDRSPIAYRRLGRRTLLVFMVRTSWVLILALLVLGGLLALLAFVPQEYSPAVATSFWIGILLAILITAGAAAAAWLRYTHYEIAMGETDFRLKRGIVAEEEIGVPYRRIKEVTIDRSPTDILFGVSSLIVTIAAEDDGAGQSSAIRLDSLGRDIAEQFQEELLKRAEVGRLDVAAAPAAAATPAATAATEPAGLH